MAVSQMQLEAIASTKGGAKAVCHNVVTLAT